MATDVSSVPVNGSHGPQSGWDGAQASNTSSNQNSANATSDIPKDEVAWFFVEQYYVTLSKHPEKLYLFYNKRSQLVIGDETDKVPVCVGQKAISTRIKDQEFQDCKVRVTNVDAQASDANIVIQVIGEISNKSQPHKKFIQTFVLAEQTNGYFVLNDIFRYLVDEEEEDAQAEEDTPAAKTNSTQAAVPATTEQATLTSSQDPAEIEQSAKLVDKELQEKIPSKEAPTPAIPAINGTATRSAATEEPSTLTIPGAAEGGLASPASIAESEKPKDPTPTPSLSPLKKPATPAVPVAAPANANATTSSAAAPAPAPSKPAAPKSWAAMAMTSIPANKAAPAPATSTAQPNATQTPSQPKAATQPTANRQSAPAPAAATEEPAARDPSPAGSQQDEWTNVGEKKQSKNQASAAQDGPQHRAYIKNVHDGIDSKQLKSALEKFGELLYFDVSRQKNCAFVDFKSAEGYKAAIDANPHQFGNDRIYVEERRMKPGSYPYVPRGGMRGGRGGAQAQGANRGAFQGNNRGNFAGRGRGGATGNARGRGGAQAA